MKRILAALLASTMLTQAAYAGSTTLAVPSGSATFREGTDGSSNLFPQVGLCDGPACANLLSITAPGTGGTYAAAIQGISGGVAVPVSGTFWQTTQPVSGTFWQTTQPVSLASLPALATGANTIGLIGNTSFAATQATAANLNATVVGTGTFAVQAAETGTWTINPATISTWGLATVAAGSAPTNMQVDGLVYNSGGVTPSNGQSVALQGDANGYLEVDIKAGASSGAVAQGSTTSGQTGGLTQAAVTTAAPKK